MVTQKSPTPGNQERDLSTLSLFSESLWIEFHVNHLLNYFHHHHRWHKKVTVVPFCSGFLTFYSIHFALCWQCNTWWTVYYTGPPRIWLWTGLVLQGCPLHLAVNGPGTTGLPMAFAWLWTALVLQGCPLHLAMNCPGTTRLPIAFGYELAWYYRAAHCIWLWMALVLQGCPWHLHGYELPWYYRAAHGICMAMNCPGTTGLCMAFAWLWTALVLQGCPLHLAMNCPGTTRLPIAFGYELPWYYRAAHCIWLWTALVLQGCPLHLAMNCPGTTGLLMAFAWLLTALVLLGYRWMTTDCTWVVHAPGLTHPSPMYIEGIELYFLLFCTHCIWGSLGLGVSTLYSWHLLAGQRCKKGRRCSAALQWVWAVLGMVPWHSASCSTLKLWPSSICPLSWYQMRSPISGISTT